MRNSTLQRRTGLKRTGFKRKPGAPKFYKWKIGRKGKANKAANVDMKKECQRLGIFECELKLPGCWREPHGFAHTKKRRNIITAADLREACLACNPCHDQIEGKPEMAAIVRDRLAKRSGLRSII